MLEQQACEVLMTDKEGYSGGAVNGTLSGQHGWSVVGRETGLYCGKSVLLSPLPFCSFLNVYFVILWLLNVCMCVCTTLMPAPLEARRGLLITWNWSRDDCEQPCKYWELNPDPFPK